MNTLLPAAIVVIALTCPVFSQPAGSGSGAAAFGFDPARLERLDAVFQDHVDRQQMAGAIMFVQRDGNTAHFRTYGMQDIEARRPMAADAIFRIASFSKVVTSVAALILYEEGRFRLHDPVSNFIPAFRNPVVAVKPTDRLRVLPGKTYATEPAKRAIQIRDLLTHLAGLTYGDGLAAADYKAAKLFDGWDFSAADETIGDAIKRLAALPLHGQPGEVWQYGFSTDVLGHLIEVVSGQPLDRFLDERIFRPLKMTDTGFFLPPEKSARLANVYGLEGGKLVLQETAKTSPYVHGPRRCFSGGSGLLSTAGDFSRFLQMLLNGGILDGGRILSPKTVELMRANHTGDKCVDLAWGFRAFGLGFWVMDDLGFHGELGSVGSYGWGSAYFSQYVVDPQERMAVFFLTQHRPSGGLDLNQRFRVLLYQALVK